MAHNATMDMMGQRPHMGAGNGVKQETVQMLKRVLTFMVICIALTVLITKRDVLLQVIDHPVSSIKVTGAFSYLKEAEVTQTLGDLVGAGFIATDLQDIQSRVEALPWVNDATVSRVWPGEVKLLINEQVAVSQWNNDGLLNAQGLVFNPVDISTDLRSLPKLIGSESFSADKKNMMLSTLTILQDGLSGYGLNVSVLELKPRNVWNMTLSNGIAVSMGEIKLNELEGRQAFEAKLERLGKVFSTASNIDTTNIARIDARYPNGVAIKWRSK